MYPFAVRRFEHVISDGFWKQGLKSLPFAGLDAFLPSFL
jgi:hypothetical protein